MPAILRPGIALVVAVIAGCAAEPPKEPPPPVAVQPPPEPPKPVVDPKARLEEARAMLAQAETDVQRARAKRALWLNAWEDLLAARASFAANDAEAAIRHARRASEFAQLGLEQLAYPAVQ